MKSRIVVTFTLLGLLIGFGSANAAGSSLMSATEPHDASKGETKRSALYEIHRSSTGVSRELIARTITYSDGHTVSESYRRADESLEKRHSQYPQSDGGKKTVNESYDVSGKLTGKSVEVDKHDPDNQKRENTTEYFDSNDKLVKKKVLTEEAAFASRKFHLRIYDGNGTLVSESSWSKEVPIFDNATREIFGFLICLFVPVFLLLLIIGLPAAFRIRDQIGHG